MNNVQLTGRITKDPEVKYMQSGTAYMGFVVAVNRKKDANGQVIADFIGCKAFGNNAEFIGKYIKKGYLLGVEGEIQTGQYKGQDGKMHYTTDVLVTRVENLTPREQSATNPQPSATYQQPQQQYQQPAATPQYQNTEYTPQVQVDDGDLPF